MTKRQIDPYHVQSVEVSIEDFSGQINGGKSDFVLDASKDAIDSLDSAIKATMENIITIVQSLNKAMNDVAESFKSVDATIAAEIESSTTVATSNSRSGQSQPTVSQTRTTTSYKTISSFEATAQGGNVGQTKATSK